MTYEMTVHPDNEKEFLETLLDDGLYLPAEAGLQLQEHVTLRYVSENGKGQRLSCIIAGRRFEGTSRTPSQVKLRPLQSQRFIIRSLLESI